MLAAAAAASSVSAPLPAAAQILDEPRPAPRLTITHQTPSDIQPGQDLVIAFTIDGDCTPPPPDARMTPFQGSIAGGVVSANAGCEPVDATVDYTAAATRRVLRAILARGDRPGELTGSATIPAGDLRPGSSLSYRIDAVQYRRDLAAGASLRQTYLDIFFLPYLPFVSATVVYKTEPTIVSAVWPMVTTTVAGAVPDCAPPPPALSGVGSDRKVELSWTTSAPPDGCGSVTHVNVFEGVPGEPTVLHTTLPASESSLELSGSKAPNGWTHAWQVSAVTQAGEGHRSPIVVTRTAGVPFAPLMFVEPTPSGNSLSWQWSPARDNGDRATKFRVYRAEDPAHFLHIDSIDVADGQMAYTDATAVDDVAYWYAVAAVNGVGEGARSQGRIVVTELSPAPDPPVITSPVSGSLHPTVVTVSGTADPKSTVRLYVDGLPSLGRTPAADGTWTVALSFHEQVDGPRNIHAIATRRNGLASEPSQTVIVDVDAGMPEGKFRTVNDTNTEDNALLRHDERLTGRAWDNRAVAGVKIRYASGSGPFTIVDADCTCGGPDAEFSAEFDPPPGRYDVWLSVRDQAGNESGWIGRVMTYSAG